MFTYGEKTKRVNDSTIYVRKIRFTTSDKEKNPRLLHHDKQSKISSRKENNCWS